MKTKIFKGENKGKSGIIVKNEWRGTAQLLTINLGESEIKVNSSHCDRNCNNCQWFERKSIETMFGTCEMTHRATEENHYCKMHSFIRPTN